MTTNRRMRERVRIDLANGEYLHGDFSYQDISRAPAVVYVHGFTSRRRGEKSTALEACCACRGWTYVAFDFRGHGDSSGTLRHLRASGLQSDLDAVADYLAAREITRLHLVGSSMGGWASAWFAVRHRELVRACMFIAPALEFLRGFWNLLPPQQQQAWQRTGRYPARNLARGTEEELDYAMYEEAEAFSLPALTERWSTPALIYHGMQDDVISYRTSLEFVSSCPFPLMELRLLKDGDHRLHRYAEPMAEAACSFFAAIR
jgi:pimeloyl-ACP methyl ester carboxylesterase